MYFALPDKSLPIFQACMYMHMRDLYESRKMRNDDSLDILAVSGDNSAKEYERYDGWFNNLANPSWGTVGKKVSF